MRHAACRQLCPSIVRNLDIHLQKNPFVDLLTNARMGLSIVKSRTRSQLIPLNWTYALEEDSPVAKFDLVSSGAQVIFAYERFPSTTNGVPVAWITSPSFPAVMEKQGYTAEAIKRSGEWKRVRAAQTAKFIFNTHVALNAFMEQNGEQYRSKSVVIPCLISDLVAYDKAHLKWESGPLKFLFVGRQARRKGLPTTVEAMTPLLKAHPEISFTIVSSMDDGAVEMPNLPNLTVTQNISREALMQLMRESHFLLMPSWFENYGFVYIEAMSQGCLPVALNNPVQLELIGDYGILLSSQDADEMHQALSTAIQSPEIYRQKALEGLANFEAKHTPHAIANQFASAFYDIAQPR